MSAWIPAPPPLSDPAMIRTRAVIAPPPIASSRARMAPLGRRREFGQRRAFPQRPVEQVTATIGAALVELVGAIGAESALERADEGAVDVGGQIAAATFAIGAHFEHVYSPAATRTASQIISTTRSTSPASSPSDITRIT